MKKFFGFGSSTPPPPAPPSKPPAPPVAKPAPPKPAPPLAEAAPSSSIVGQWREPAGVDTTEFRADGTVMEMPASGDAIRGRYTLDGVKLKIRLDGVPDELAFGVNVKADALEMTDPDGSMTHYTRVK